jgi:hypothetical protein
MTDQSPHAYFYGGTLVLDGVGQEIQPPRCFKWTNAKWRCPACFYRLA